MPAGPRNPPFNVSLDRYRISCLDAPNLLGRSEPPSLGRSHAPCDGSGPASLYPRKAFGPQKERGAILYGKTTCV